MRARSARERLAYYHGYAAALRDAGKLVRAGESRQGALERLDSLMQFTIDVALREMAREIAGLTEGQQRASPGGA